MDQQIGRYQILDEIAWGGQGAVYRVFDPETGQIVALKVLHRFPSNDTSYVERFQREASLAASIDHPNVVKIYDVGQDGDRHFIALEFLPESLARVIEGGGQMRLDRVTQFGVQIADGLAEAHALGIVHRNIKPENVLIGPDGLAKVTDFGIARAAVLSSVTATGEVVGSPHYMSPEQSRGQETDARSDIYSLGCLLYQMVTGELPFKGNTPLAVVRQQIEDDPKPIRELRADLAPALESLVERAMAKDLDRRFQTASELSDALRELLPDMGAETRKGVPLRYEPTIALPNVPTRSTTAASLSWMERWVQTWQWAKRSPWALPAGMLSLVLALSVGAARPGLWDEVSGFVGTTPAETIQSSQEPPVFEPPGAPGAPAPFAGSVAVPTAAGETSDQSPASPGSVDSVSTPASPMLPILPIEVFVEAEEPTRLVSSQGEVIVDVAAGAVRDDLTLTYKPVAPEHVPRLPSGFTLSDSAFDLSVTGVGVDEGVEFSFNRPIVVTVRLGVREIGLSGGASANAHTHAYAHADDRSHGDRIPYGRPVGHGDRYAYAYAHPDTNANADTYCYAVAHSIGRDGHGYEGRIRSGKGQTESRGDQLHGWVGDPDRHGL